MAYKRRRSFRRSRRVRRRTSYYRRFPLRIRSLRPRDDSIHTRCLLDITGSITILPNAQRSMVMSIVPFHTTFKKSLSNVVVIPNARNDNIILGFYPSVVVPSTIGNFTISTRTASNFIDYSNLYDQCRLTYVRTHFHITKMNAEIASGGSRPMLYSSVDSHHAINCEYDVSVDAANRYSVVPKELDSTTGDAMTGSFSTRKKMITGQNAGNPFIVTVRPNGIIERSVWVDCDIARVTLPSTENQIAQTFLGLHSDSDVPFFNPRISYMIDLPDRSTVASSFGVFLRLDCGVAFRGSKYTVNNSTINPNDELLGIPEGGIPLNGNFQIPTIEDPPRDYVDPEDFLRQEPYEPNPID